MITKDQDRDLISESQELGEVTEIVIVLIAHFQMRFISTLCPNIIKFIFTNSYKKFFNFYKTGVINPGIGSSSSSLLTDISSYSTNNLTTGQSLNTITNLLQNPPKKNSNIAGLRYPIQSVGKAMYTINMDGINNIFQSSSFGRYV